MSALHWAVLGALGPYCDFLVLMAMSPVGALVLFSVSCFNFFVVISTAITVSPLSSILVEEPSSAPSSALSYSHWICTLFHAASISNKSGGSCPGSQ